MIDALLLFLIIYLGYNLRRTAAKVNQNIEILATISEPKNRQQKQITDQSLRSTKADVCVTHTPEKSEHAGPEDWEEITPERRKVAYERVKKLREDNLFKDPAFDRMFQ